MCHYTTGKIAQYSSAPTPMIVSVYSSWNEMWPHQLQFNIIHVTKSKLFTLDVTNHCKSFTYVTSEQ